MSKQKKCPHCNGSGVYTEPERVKWACPRCGAEPSTHGKGGADACKSMGATCMGFICECDEDQLTSTHGEMKAEPCLNAVCYHCDWSGKMPHAALRKKA